MNEFLDFMINTNIAGNLPNSFLCRATGIFASDTTQYMEEVSRDYFLSDTNEFIVDNTDPGCKITQPSTLLKLVKNEHLKSPKSWIRFINFKEENAIFPTSQWKEYIDQNCQGTTIRSFVFTRGKSGDYRLTWEADLPKEGVYEAFVYIPSYSLNMMQKYKISPLGGEEKVVYVDTRGEWCSLGVYNCLPGVNKISLSDEGEENQIILGDAIKWVYQGKAME